MIRKKNKKSILFIALIISVAAVLIGGRTVAGGGADAGGAVAGDDVAAGESAVTGGAVVAGYVAVAGDDAVTGKNVVAGGEVTADESAFASDSIVAEDGAIADEIVVAGDVTVVGDNVIAKTVAGDSAASFVSDSAADLMPDSVVLDPDDVMGGFDPDADFGGLGFEIKTGPGRVSIGALDADGEYIDGIAITENGMRTKNRTTGGVPYVIERVPYGEHIYGIYLTYSFSIDSVSMIKYEDTGGGSEEMIRIDVADVENLPPVVISDETVRWEITFILRQYMGIDVNYYMVSPNDRFYYLYYIEEKNEIAYRINTFEGAPVRVAVYIEMPALKNICKIRVEGEGFGNTGIDAVDPGIMDSNEPGGDENESITAGMPATLWTIENAFGDYILPDWTAVDRSFQLIADESILNPDNTAFIRFFILSLPSAYEGARLRFDKIIFTDCDGNEIELSNTDKSDLSIQLVAAPEAL